MPNHVTTRCRVSGSRSDLREFRERVFTEGQLDFESIIPRPAILSATTSGSCTQVAKAIVNDPAALRKAENLRLQFDLHIKNETPEAAEQLPHILDTIRMSDARIRARDLKRSFKGALKLATISAEAFRRTGYYDWYDWSCENWGTKWNAYSTVIETDQPEYLEFTFDTAWSFPEPVFERIAAEFPKLEITTDSFDEGWGFACRGGSEDGGWTLEDVDTSDDMYEQVYGARPERDEEEEETP